MDQLELRFYPREEISKIVGVRLDSKNFGRDVESKLSNAGYRCEYRAKRGVFILSKPETPEERLAEILYRGFGIDIQINAEQFACFIAAFTDIEGFSSQPWAMRETLYRDYYGFDVRERTLRSWCSQLIECGVIAKVGGSTRWRTYYDGGKKIQEPIDEVDEVEMQNYYERRSELFKDNYIAELERGFPPIVARKSAWKWTYSDLWAEFQCCFYYCKGLTLNAFSYNDVDVRDIYELCRGLAAAAPPPIEASAEPPTTQFEF